RRLVGGGRLAGRGRDRQPRGPGRRAPRRGRRPPRAASASTRSRGRGAARAALQAFDRERAAGFALATVYLPGCDIGRDAPENRARAVARVAGWLAPLVEQASRGEIVLVVVAADSHLAPAALGRMVVFDGAVAPRTVRIRPVDASPSILARLGVPRAADLEGAPVASLFAP